MQLEVRDIPLRDTCRNCFLYLSNTWDGCICRFSALPSKRDQYLYEPYWRNKAQQQKALGKGVEHQDLFGTDWNVLHWVSKIDWHSNSKSRFKCCTAFFFVFSWLFILQRSVWGRDAVSASQLCALSGVCLFDWRRSWGIHTQAQRTGNQIQQCVLSKRLCGVVAMFIYGYI